MAELMIAVVILGIGLLITSSMFPIAWFKAREVAEGTVVPAQADASEVTVKLMCRTSQPQAPGNNPLYKSSFFPGDWFPQIVGASELAAVFPDTRVHHLNTGNYLADMTLAADSTDFTYNNDGDVVPVADDAWKLEDNLDVVLNGLQQQLLLAGSDIARGPQFRAHERLSIPLEARPPDSPPAAATALERTHWEERFELRRHCRSVFYRFNELPGLEYAVWQSGLTTDQKRALADQRLRLPRQLSMYYLTLKRRVGARYARQQGYNPDVSSPEVANLSNPQPLGPEFDVRLPVPWRFQATLVTLPSASAAGLPAEIRIPQNTVIAQFLDDGYVIIDDRTGRVFTITDRRDAVIGGQSTVILTLDGEYTAREIEDVPDYEPMVSTNVSDTSQWSRFNWRNVGIWRATGCDADPLPTACNFLKEPEPELRRYWVFPPPVDAQRGPNGTLLFNGSPPVIGVELRQLTL